MSAKAKGPRRERQSRQWSETASGCATDTLAVRPYLSAKQLAAVTPWTVNAIWKMVGRGVLQRNVHYFRPIGRRREIVFKWSAVVALIEGTEQTKVEDPGTRKGMDVQQAAEELERLLG